MMWDARSEEGVRNAPCLRNRCVWLFVLACLHASVCVCVVFCVWLFACLLVCLFVCVFCSRGRCLSVCVCWACVCPQTCLVSEDHAKLFRVSPREDCQDLSRNLLTGTIPNESTSLLTCTSAAYLLMAGTCFRIRDLSGNSAV